LQDTTLDSAPQQNSYLGLPKIGGKQILGYPIAFGDYKEEIMKFSPENDIRMIFPLSTDEIDNFEMLPVKLGFRFTFTEQVFVYQYFSLKDLLADIGGVGGAITAALGSFGVYMIMLFIVDLIFIIKKKYKQEKRTHNIKIYGRKLDLYKEIIEQKQQIIKSTHDKEGDGHADHDHEGGVREKVDPSTMGEKALLEHDMKTVNRLKH
jgi:hypothetical protein